MNRDRTIRRNTSDTLERRHRLVSGDDHARLYLMRELLADTGSIYVHLDWTSGITSRLVLDEVFWKINPEMRSNHGRYSHNDRNKFRGYSGTLFFSKARLLFWPVFTSN